MSNFGVVPAWFVDLLSEWAHEYSGWVVDLRANGCTQRLWGGRSGGAYLTTPQDREALNAAFGSLEKQVPALGQLLRFYYLQRRAVTMRDVERHFCISTRVAADQRRAAEAALFGYYLGVRGGAGQ